MTTIRWPQIEPDLGELEPAYRQHFLAMDIGQVVLGCIFGTISATALAVIDYQFYGFSRPFYELALIRGLFLLFSLFSIRALRKATCARDYERLILIWLAALILVLLIVDLYRPANFVQNQMIHTLVAFCCYAVIPVPLRYRVIPAAAISAWDIITLFFFKTNVPPPVLGITLATMVIMHLTGIFVSARLYTYRRRQYQAQVQEQKVIKKLEVMATSDSLTGLFNHRCFIELAKTEFSRYQRSGTTFTLIMIDLDRFKEINDNFGHQYGDQTLMRFAAMAHQEKRVGDTIGRLGGDEFGILLPDTTTDNGIFLVERICQGCQGIAVQTAKGAPVITVSAGIAEVQAQDHQIDDMIRRADEALYRAKANGRNRCETA